METVNAVITHNVVAMRAEPDGSAEQVSQAIMGDAITCLEERDGYARIRTADAYEGWALRHHLRLAAPDDPYRASAPRASASLQIVKSALLEVFGNRKRPARLLTKLPFGARVYRPAATLQVVLANGEEATIGYDRLLPLSHRPVWTPGLVCALAGSFIGTPYLWGGTTPFGFDCSGFVQRLYAFYGVSLPRDAYQQAASPLGVQVPAGEPHRAGDLVFFCGDRDPRGRGITHVGMALDAATFVHASGKEGVAITPFSDSYYVRTYRVSWRYLSPSPSSSAR